MPVQSSKVSIPNGSSVELVAASNMEQDVAVTNASADNSFFIDGDDQVSASTGFPVKAEESITFTLGAGDRVFGIASADGVQANVLVITTD
jgi:hypothetical protein